jgi:hypothetical protein
VRDTFEKGQEAIQVFFSECDKMMLKKSPDKDGIKGNITLIP